MITEKIVTITKNVNTYCRSMNYAVLRCNRMNETDEYAIAQFFSLDDAKAFCHVAQNQRSSETDFYEVRKIVPGLSE